MVVVVQAFAYRASRKIPVALPDLVASLPLCIDQHVAAIEGFAEGDGGELLLAVAFAGLVELILQLDAVEVGLGDQVDHARDRIGTVGGGGTVTQHLDPLDDRRGDQVEIDEAVYARRGHAVAVQQHQGPVGSETTQGYRCPPRCAVIDTRAEIGAGYGWQVDQESLQRRVAGRIECRFVEHRNGADAVDIAALDTRTGNDDLFHGAGCFLGKRGWTDGRYDGSHGRSDR